MKVLSDKDLSWEGELIEANNEILRKLIRLLESKRGLILMYIFLHVNCFCFWYFTKESFLTTILYFSTLFLYGLIITNLPDSIFRWLYPEVSIPDSSVLLMKYASYIHYIYETLLDLYKSCFVRTEIFSISALTSVIFGILLILRKMPIYGFIHCLFVCFLLFVTYFIHKPSVSKTL